MNENLNYALVFPGQGSQTVGMCKEFYNNFGCAKNIFEEADDALNFNLTRLMFEGPEEELTLTENAQPAILTASIAVLKVLTDEMKIKLNPVCVAGHSLGEYTALVASKVLKFSDGVKLVNKRGKFMQEAVEPGVGSMAAILGLSSEEVISVCESVAKNHECQPANFNAPGQVVISGLNDFVDMAVNEAKGRGAKRAIKLNVSAPFHSRLMISAANKLNEEFKKIDWDYPEWQIISNVDARPVEEPKEIQANLFEQTFSPVLWQNSVEYMADKLKINAFFEIGSGEVLSGLIKRTIKGINIKSTGTPQKLEELAECLR